MTHIDRRLRRLETRRSSLQDVPYTPLEPPPEWYKEVYGLLIQYGYLHEVLRSWGLSESEVAVWAAAIAEECTDATL